MRLSLLLILLLSFTGVYAQKHVTSNDSLDKLRHKIIQGDFEALRTIGFYLDSKKEVADFLGYHYHISTEGYIAWRIIQENSFFTEDELKIDSTLTTQKFHSFLNNNKEKLIYSEETGAFLITPFEARKTNYRLRQMTTMEINSLKTNLSQQPYPGWIFDNNIDFHIKTQNPKCLILIASNFLHQRLMRNIYDFNDEQYIDYLKYLTHLEFGVPNEKNEISFLYHLTSTEARMNLLTYFVTHIKDYAWSEEEKYFINTGEKAEGVDKETTLFGLLNSKNDSTALDAFSQLMECDVEKVQQLADEYHQAGIRNNYALPTFPYRFLQQGVVLTAWWRKNGIDYKLSESLGKQLDSLRNMMPFALHYGLENRIVRQLTVDQITSLEYFGLIYEKNFSSTYSIGRILDKFYSQNWTTIISTEKHLLTYLKKAALFDQLGIIGICNKYLKKFENCSPAVLATLASLKNKTDDKDIHGQIEQILHDYKNPVPKILPKIEKSESSKDYHITGISSSYKKILRSTKNRDDKEHDLKQLFGKINYQQLGEALQLFATDTLLDNYDKYNILESDFGFSMNSYDSLTISKFKADYSKFTEKEMYRRNVIETGTDIFTATGELDYNKVYDVLKYDVVDAFVGGGGGRRDDNVYGVIKLLEFQFNTRLGFPKKLCSWQGIWGCNCEDQMKYWMNFLEEKKLVTIDPAEPRSVSYNE